MIPMAPKIQIRLDFPFGTRSAVIVVAELFIVGLPVHRAAVLRQVGNRGLPNAIALTHWFGNKVP